MIADATFWTGVALTLASIFGAAALLSIRPATAPDAEPAPADRPARPPAHDYTCEFVGGLMDGYLLHLPDRPGDATFGVARYRAGEPSPSGKVKMMFAGYQNSERVGG